MQKDHDPSVPPTRWLGSQITKLLIKTRITPNDISWTKLLILLPLSFYFLIQGKYLYNLIALFLVVLGSILDAIDGEIARKKKLASPAGAWLDGMSDVVFLQVILGAVAINVLKSTGDFFWLFVGVAAIIGQDATNVMGSFFTRDFDFNCYSGSEEFRKKFTKIKKISLFDSFLKNIIVPSNFIYTFFFTCRYLFLLGILFNHLEIFILLFAITINIRWIAMFYLYFKYLQERKTKFHTIEILREIGTEKRSKTS